MRMTSGIRIRHVVAGIVACALIVAAAVGLVTTRASRLSKTRTDAILSKKEKPEAVKVGKSVQATRATQDTKASINAGKHPAATRQLIDPSEATQTGISASGGPRPFRASHFTRFDRDAAIGLGIWLRPEPFVSKFAGGDPDQQANSATTPGEGPIGGFEAYRAASRTYPAGEIPPQVVENAKTTFLRTANADARNGDPKAKGHRWSFYAPMLDATQPGVTSFSGATNSTASRVTAMLVAADCNAMRCRVWVGVSGGAVWRTDNALAPDPDWKQLHPTDLDQASVGTLALDPTDPTSSTIYLGTGEGNRCSSGCESGVGIYKSTDNGEHWTKLADKCVDNATYQCVNAGGDAFLGRGINSIVVDPRNANQIFVGSALAVRGLSHVIGSGGQTRLEPGSNAVGLYESTDGGRTFTEVWNGNSKSSFGITDVGLDPLNSSVVYASAFDAGVWRRDAGAGQTAFLQVFAPQFPGGGIDRTMFALTVKNGHTRAYLTDGTANNGGITGATASNFWRTDNANQPAAALLASQAADSTPPNPATHTFPATYPGWQVLTSKMTGNPYFATDDFCTGQCWYDQAVYTPAGMPDTVYVIGSNQYGEQPCDTNGVGCGNGRSNGREVLYSTTAGDPDGANNLRTFTDLSYDATVNHPSWCAYQPYFDNGCTNAPNGIHPDQHAIAINPGNPTQIFEGSDGGVIRTSGSFADVSSQCDERHRNGGGPLPSTSGSYTACKRLLSRVPTLIEHVNKKLSSTLQFINVAINPSDSRRVLGGTQDNGTWANLDPSATNTFSQVIYGDGGNAVFDLTNPGWLANEFTGGFGDANFENGDPTKWVIATGPIVASNETVAFYWPQIGDPNPLPGTHPIYNGAQHVWRSWAFGAGTPGQVPQDTTPRITDYELNCPEFVTFGGVPTCGDYLPLGGPAGSNQPGDLTGSVYGRDRTGGSISWLARDSADHGTLWAATSAGRIFVTHNADAADPGAVTWHRIDSSTSGGSPTRFPSGIYVDPADNGHAWISYSGYNAATPSTPGHVFEVKENGSVPGSGLFTNLNVEAGTAFPTPTNNGDLPASDVVRDDANQTLYVSTDFGVLRGDADGTGGWHVTAGMPRYEVMHLEIQPSSRVPTCAGGAAGCTHVLYAATHSRGIWRMQLGN
jgi:hypothetical protein